MVTALRVVEKEVGMYNCLVDCTRTEQRAFVLYGSPSVKIVSLFSLGGYVFEHWLLENQVWPNPRLPYLNVVCTPHLNPSQRDDELCIFILGGKAGNVRLAPKKRPRASMPI